jgi:hypothetical protein
MVKKRTQRLTLFVCLLAFGLGTLIAPAQGLAQERPNANDVSTPAVVGDLLVVRPLGVVSIVAGSIIFAGTFPFSVWGGTRDLKTAGRTLVANPAVYTFNRPVGDFQEGRYD